MKKLLIFLLIVIVLGAVAYAGYRFYLPSMIAEALTSDQPSAMVPAAMQEKVTNLKTKVNREAKKIPVFLKEQKIGYDDLLNIIDRTDPDELLDAYQAIATTKFTSIDQVFDIGKKHIKIEGYDLEIFRGPFLQYVTIEDVHKSIEKVEQNKLLTSMSIPVAKETLKQVLESLKPAIQQELDQLNKTSGE